MIPTPAALSTLSDPHSATTLAGPLPVAEGEDQRGYEELLGRILRAVQPADIFEEMWVHDIAELAWDAFRLRRYKAHAFTSIAADRIRDLIAPFVVGDAREVARQWELGNEAAAERVSAALAAAGLSTRDVVTRKIELYEYHLKNFARIERMLANMEERRSAALRHLERHRENFGARLREAIEAEQERACKVLAPPLAPDRP